MNRFKRLLGYAQREPIRPRPIDVNEIIVYTLDQSRQFADPVARDVRLQKDLWLTCVDPDQLATSLLNLMFNARDVFAETSRLIIETTNARVDHSEVAEPQEGRPGEYVGLFIESSLHGHSLETAKAAVESLSARKEPGKGGWLSLSLMHELVQRSGGYWTISSEPAHETSIRVYLPRYIADADKAEHNPLQD